MRKSIVFVSIVFAVFCLFPGCSNSRIPSLPQDAQEIPICDYTNPENPDDSFANCVEYGGRLFVLYGTQSKTIDGRIIKECVGYIDNDSDNRIYTLFDTGDYIASYYTSGIMEQFTFLRAVDTRGKDIYTPDYISDLGYDLWK